MNNPATHLTGQERTDGRAEEDQSKLAIIDTQEIFNLRNSWDPRHIYNAH
jgi:hypothetical protein